MEVLNLPQMPSTPRRTRNDNFCHNSNNLYTPAASALHDAACSIDATGCDFDVDDTSDKESDGEEDDGEDEAVLAPSDQGFRLRQAGRSLLIEDAAMRVPPVPNMISLQQDERRSSPVLGHTNEEDEDDDDVYNAVDDIPDEDDEDLNDPLDVSRLFSQEELPSDPINDVPMRSIEVADEGYVPQTPKGQFTGGQYYNMDFQLQQDLNLLSPTSMSKFDFPSSGVDMSGYEAESDNETVMNDQMTMMTSTFPGSIDPASTLKSTASAKQSRRKNRFARTKKPRPPKMGTFVVPSYKAVVLPYADSKELEIRPPKRLPTDADIDGIISNRSIVNVTACIQPHPLEMEPELPKPTITFPAEDPFNVFSDPTLGNGTNEAMLHAVDLDSEALSGAYDYPLYAPADIDLNMFKTHEINSDQESEDSDCDSNFSTFFDLDAELGDSRKRKASSVVPLPATVMPRAKRVRV